MLKTRGRSGAQEQQQDTDHKHIGKFRAHSFARTTHHARHGHGTRFLGFIVILPDLRPSSKCQFDKPLPTASPCDQRGRSRSSRPHEEPAPMVNDLTCLMTPLSFRKDMKNPPKDHTDRACEPLAENNTEVAP